MLNRIEWALGGAIQRVYLVRGFMSCRHLYPIVHLLFSWSFFGGELFYLEKKRQLLLLYSTGCYFSLYFTSYKTFFKYRGFGGDVEYFKLDIFFF